MEVVITTDNKRLDIDLIHQFLTHSYWAEGRSKGEVQKSIKHSLNFGVYLQDGSQNGFARVVSDYTIFGYLLDVFILEEYQGKGYAKKLVQAVFAHPELQEVQRWMLGTKDAHGLYEKFGFKKVEDASRLMRR